MNIVENFKMALDSIKANKLRSFLTMLGIIIGISSVITILALGRGGKNSIVGEFEKIGAATINIKVNTQKAESSDYFNLEDIRQIKEKVELIKYITPVSQKQGVIRSEDKSKVSIISGGNEDLNYIQNLEIIYGRFFTEKEANEGKPVVVIDEVGAKSLFGYADVIGKTVVMGQKTSPKKVTIIGVYKSTGFSYGGVDENIPAFTIVPIAVLKDLFPNDFVIDSMMIASKDQDKGEEAATKAINILEIRHNNRGRDLYKGENILKQLDQINKVVDIFTAFIGAVAAISLLVGGIGVMNIMLVSVTERTREIGIRKAIGATTNTILLQFLAEAIIISLLGGVIGMILGIGAAYIIGSFVNITPILSLQSILGVILFSSAVGIFFGIYPARKAAKLDPIEALRYE
ncbi:ABC transporter permease [Clostridium algidicarnis]|uniref:ABC transporter permease n=1 Tax=Clostridium algidicarnis TaxID=37659 RepID=UPI001C0CA26A|nr:ABC transporter permease [Clostridium algidicarnis]MBU3194585.1 ABC transporter permease [Clostridium algidicarnis]